MTKAPTDALTTREFKRYGWRYGKTEFWKAFHPTKDDPKPRGGVRVDLFGFVDYIAITPFGFLFVQVTADSGISARVKKIRGECADAATDILHHRGLIEVWGWKHAGPRKPWMLRRMAVLLDVTGELFTEKVEP